MKTLPDDMQTALSGGATTLCACWRVERSDGAVLCFTDHDAAITFDGLVFEPQSAISATAMAQSSGYDLDNGEIAGALSSDAIDPSDVARGLFDGAEIERWLVDWSAPATRMLMFRGSLGEIRRRGDAFEAELRGLSHGLSKVIGRELMPSCDARLGDTRCGVDLSLAAYSAAATIQSVTENRELRVDGASGYEADWFTRGRLQIASIDGAALDIEIAAHRRDALSAAAGDLIVLAETPTPTLTTGLAVTLVAGCDKRAATCRDKFANFLNFRGFPHVPGDDWLLAYPRRDQPLDGSSTQSSG